MPGLSSVTPAARELIMSTRPDSSWIVNVAGPDKAYSYEMNLYETKRREGPDQIAAANHFLDPTWHIEISDEDLCGDIPTY